MLAGACAVVKHPPPISPSRRRFTLEPLCQVRPVLALPTDRISNISATPTHRLCTRMKMGMWDDSGNQSLTARAATEDTNMPTPLYHKNLRRIATHSPVCSQWLNAIFLRVGHIIGPYVNIALPLWTV